MVDLEYALLVFSTNLHDLIDLKCSIRNHSFETKMMLNYPLYPLHYPNSQKDVICLLVCHRDRVLILFFFLFMPASSLKSRLPHAHAYADDTQLYLSFKPDSAVGETEARFAMEQCIRAVRAWMVVDKLKLNEEKTEFMLIGTHQQLSKVLTDSLLVTGTVVSSVSEARNLGVWFDSKFQFQTHINKTCQSAFYYIYNIRRIRKFLSFEAAKSLVQALVISGLDYCNSVLYGIPAIHTNKLQRAQNAAARLLTNRPRYSHRPVRPVLIGFNNHIFHVVQLEPVRNLKLNNGFVYCYT